MHSNGQKLTAKQRMDMVEEGVASPEQAQEYLSISKTHLYALMGAGKIPFIKVGRARRLPWRSLKQYAADLLKGE